MSLTNDEVFEILKLIDESGYDYFRLEIGDTNRRVLVHAKKTIRTPCSAPRNCETSLR